jgi:Fic family protein
MEQALAWLAASRDQGSVDRDYHHWDELRYRKPPEGLDLEGWWLALKLMRRASARVLPLKDVAGGGMHFSMPDAVVEALHHVDSLLRGNIVVTEQITDPANRDRYIVSTLMEEAITSSQLEGAATTQRVAKEMLRSGRPPRTRGERMILNNFEAMRFVQEVRARPLTRAIVLRLQEIVTREALDDPSAVGRLRRSDEDVRVVDVETGETVHVPPAAEELDRRLEAMIAFANGEPEGPFVHPVVRAILVHFWLAYDHPFVDGNGRTARALFYWCMLHSEYWLCEYISLSKVLRAAPAAYARAYQFVETDEGDATYFLVHQLHAIRTATDELVRFIRRKQKQVRETEALLRDASDLNHRQIALLSHALRHPDASYTLHSHGMSQNVAYATARADLLGLVASGLLVKRRSGKTFIFHPVQHMDAGIARLRRQKRAGS